LAIAARMFLVEMMAARTKPPLNRALGYLPQVRVKIGEMDALIEGARAVLWKAAAEFELDPPGDWARKAAAAKMIAIENSSRVLDLGMRVAGGSSFAKKFPLERMFRDVKAGLFHPLDTDQTLDFLGLTAFGFTDPDPGIVDLETRDAARRAE
jgi:alkylation response protein AidB-like acyl-CoA dehydrogenase